MASCHSAEGDHEISRHDKAILSRIFNPGLPSSDFSEEIERPELCEVVAEDDKVKEAKALEVQGVNAAEQGDIDMAINSFSEAIQVAPHWPSAYNNRAQALRLKGDAKGALEDLNMAVVLSKGEGNSACQAFTQRALIKRLEGDEEGALEDFKAAAGLGNEFAKQMLVALNPYAALCNQMLGEVMTKLRAGQDPAQ
ncbi:tetratricopeptide repeat protein 36-like [Babylonia areolata]|uniref:tetratricopeptide repeat protein 36-like n=1 Tax=Babylonia areolata TaxID=304850 RepID=UPI003FD69930